MHELVYIYRKIKKPKAKQNSKQIFFIFFLLPTKKKPQKMKRN